MWPPFLVKTPQQTINLNFKLPTFQSKNHKSTTNLIWTLMISSWSQSYSILRSISNRPLVRQFWMLISGPHISWLILYRILKTRYDTTDIYIGINQCLETMHEIMPAYIAKPHSSQASLMYQQRKPSLAKWIHEGWFKPLIFRPCFLLPPTDP